MQYIEINRRVKSRPLTWNEKLTRKNIPTWAQMLSDLKTI